MNQKLLRSTFHERYQAAYTLLKSALAAGEIQPGQYLPSENELAIQFELSRPSIRKLLHVLSEEGMVRVERGKGTIVEAQCFTSETIRLFWPAVSFEYPSMKQIVESFNQNSSAIRVELIPYSQSSISELLDMTTELKPDLIAISNTDFMSLTSDQINKYLYPIQFPESTSVYPSFIRAFTSEGLLYSAPLIFTPIVLAYNKTLFKDKSVSLPDPDWDLDRLLIAARKLTLQREKALPHVYGFSFSTTLNRWPALILANGGKLDDIQRADSHHNPAFDALRYTMDLMYTHKVSPIYSASNGDLGESLFIRGKAAMIMTSYSFMGQFKQMEFDWEFAGFPSSGQPRSSFGISIGISIPTNSSMKDAAMSFIRFLLSDKIQAYLKRCSSSLPVVEHISTNRKNPYNPHGSNGYYAFVKLMEGMETLGDSSLDFAGWNMYQQELNLAWAGMLSLEEALSAARERIKHKPIVG